jgi:hypothetical protein
VIASNPRPRRVPDNFPPEYPVNGEQFVFTRVRRRASGLVPAETYRITHPFGVETLRADGAPPLVINFTRDIASAPLAFGAVLTGDVGPFLTFLAGAPPPPGTIGNPAGNQTVTGSACGTNFFKVEGPGLPSSGVRTDQFSTLIGKVAFYLDGKARVETMARGGTGRT